MATTGKAANEAGTQAGAQAGTQAGAGREAGRPRLSAGQIVLYAILIFYGVFSLGPFVYAVLSSFKNDAEVLATPPTLLPHVWTFQHYHDIFAGGIDFPFPRYLITSLLYAGLTAGLNVLLGAMAGYAFGRMEFAGTNILFALTLAVMMIPSSLILIPKFLVAYTLHITDNFAGLLVPAMVGPSSVFLMTQFLKSLPKELEESAAIDGASRFRTFWQIILPLVRPVMITVALFQFQGAWNDFLWPPIVMSNPNNYTLTVGLAFFKGIPYTQYGLLLAGAAINIAPLVVIFFIFQRYFLKGISTSGLAGR